MIVPQFWAEARVHQPRAKGRPQVTVRRFGWSDSSQAEAEKMAQQRAQEAFDRVVSGSRLPRREPKVAYNGASGVPIREETLLRKGDVVVTRNAYGAHCLNTPDVLFADIDFNQAVRAWNVVACMGVLLISAIYAGVRLESGKLGFWGGFLALFFGYPVAVLLAKLLEFLRGGSERIARHRIDAFIGKHAAWHVRLYRTPAGFRVLAMHALFDPTSPEVTDCFEALGVDRLYGQMCRNQHCFRARISPKPWRIGIGAHMKPRPGIWPIRPEQMEARSRWIQQYEATARSFASCRFIASLGSGLVHHKAASVQALHDQSARALDELTIA